MNLWLAVAAGSALGGMARYGMGMAVDRAWSHAFPLGTLLINIIGSFVIALFGVLSSTRGPLAGQAELRVFVMVGVCGGFTTFSSFSLQTLQLAEDGMWPQAALYVALSVILCVLAALAGTWVALRLAGIEPYAG